MGPGVPLLAEDALVVADEVGLDAGHRRQRPAFVADVVISRCQVDRTIEGALQFTVSLGGGFESGAARQRMDDVAEVHHVSGLQLRCRLERGGRARIRESIQREE